MRSHKPSHRRPPRGAGPRVRHFKRKLHFSEGEVWSWQTATTQEPEVGRSYLGVRIRSPTGETYWVRYDKFFTVVGDRHGVINGEPCRGDCYFMDEARCEPFRLITKGPGFQPSTIKRYIQTVIKEGKPWVREVE